MFAPPFQRIQDAWPEKRRIVIRTQVTFIFEGQAPKTRPLPIKTRVIWELYVNTYIYIYIFKYARVDQHLNLEYIDPYGIGRMSWSSVYAEPQGNPWEFRLTPLPITLSYRFATLRYTRKKWPKIYCHQMVFFQGDESHVAIRKTSPQTNKKESSISLPKKPLHVWLVHKSRHSMYRCFC